MRWGGRLLVFALLALSARAAESGRVDYNFQIRPLLSDRCYTCHGPDDKARKKKLRLDTREGMFKELEDGFAVVRPGDTNRSELVRRIFTTDEDDVMPPADSKLKLSAAEKALLQRWVAEGADFKAHWSLIPVEKISPPTPRDAKWVRNPIDAFMLARLEAEKLSPAPEAARETLAAPARAGSHRPAARRWRSWMHFSPISRPRLTRRAVERYLNSPAYGERMAMDWLDLARYADTYGYQADVERDLSPWRDWVIRAFNENLPYNDFLVWQLAGDLLPNATRDQRLATAFNRLHRQTNEGGSIEEEFRAEYVADRCEHRRHGHARPHARLRALSRPQIRSGQAARLLFALCVLQQHRRVGALLALHPGHAHAHAAAVAGGEGKRNTPNSKPKSRQPKRGSTQISRDAQASLSGLAPDRWKNPPAAAGRPFRVRHDRQQHHARQLFNQCRAAGGRSGAGGRDRRLGAADEFALQFSGDNQVVCKDVGNFTRTDPFSFSLWLKPTERQDRAVVLHHSRAWTDSGSRGYELVLDHGQPFFGLIHFWPGNAIAVRAKQALPTNEWSQVVVTYDGSSRAAASACIATARRSKPKSSATTLYKDITHRAAWGDAEVGGIQLTLAARFRDNGFKNGLIDDLQVFDVALTAPEVAGSGGARPLTRRDPATHGRADRALPIQQLLDYFLARQYEPYRAALAELQQLRAQENALVNDVPEIMVMQEMPQARADLRPEARRVRCARRSRSSATRRPASARFPPNAPRNRLGLAQWMVDRNNPLTARVAVNRIWKMHFGRGIVATLDDFGSQGKLPTHPELLDWLAGWFMDNGWDVKALHRLIVNSATYRQSSQASRELVARDPDNLLLARGPKQRLPAEQIRDGALAASGLLNRTMGGPSVKPYQPAGLWEASGTGKSYTQDHGDKLYRRSLYTFWRRTAPPPSMLTFDALSREVCTAKRETTTTPLQALVLLNDPQFIEAARVLGERLLKEYPADVDARTREAFRALTGRLPDEKEMAVLRQLFDEQRSFYAKESGAADKLLATGESKWDEALPRADFAATTMLVSAIMNFDEFIMVR